MLTVTKIFEFDAAHHLPNYNGKCKNNHGHRWVVEVEVGPLYFTETLIDGMVLDFKKLNELCKEIEDTFDHQTINDFIDNPTAENMILWIKDYIENILPEDYRLERIRLYETPTSFAEWTR